MQPQWESLEGDDPPMMQGEHSEDKQLWDSKGG